ncbi:hypothetical protein M3Y98_00665300 [Aphelenchoides besseyi]|nr:hypothetical protein M3Y98_00665300 [Aphelenchoides besseyi]KAI6208837.1 hypothetical protein M3Y96_00157400 [Aphelenchoides besseyi]
MFAKTFGVLFIVFLFLNSRVSGAANAEHTNPSNERSIYGNVVEIIYQEDIKERCELVNYDVDKLSNELMSSRHMEIVFDEWHKDYPEFASTVLNFTEKQILGTFLNLPYGKFETQHDYIVRFMIFVSDAAQKHQITDNIKLNNLLEVTSGTVFLANEFMTTIANNTAIIGFARNQFQAVHPNEIIVRTEYKNVTVIKEKKMIRAMACLYTAANTKLYKGYERSADLEVSHNSSQTDDSNTKSNAAETNKKEKTKIVQGTKSNYFPFHVIQMQSEFLAKHNFKKAPDFIIEHNSTLMFIDGAKCTQPKAPLFVYSMNSENCRDTNLERIVCSKSAVVFQIEMEMFRDCYFVHSANPYETIFCGIDQTIIMHQSRDTSLSEILGKSASNDAVEDMVLRLFNGATTWIGSNFTAADANQTAASNNTTCLPFTSKKKHLITENDGFDSFEMCVVSFLLFLSLLVNLFLVVYKFYPKRAEDEEYGSQYVDSRINFVRFVNHPETEP